ncbi:bifunctional folylpolyglutamate synthase/dihydrofolate synthase [candidate division WOR-3 bacterium]|nr:bifunctional folylpolyglutamate synthase/dihydrofolate synthase [candidate division WOR-3 bacterium]
MDFKEAVEFIYSFRDWERGAKYRFDLSKLNEFLKKIGSPHSQIKRPVLVAGTKGKGSTARILSSIFGLAGKTGAFTSPHLINIRERIKINDESIPETKFIEILEEIKPLMNDKLSTFEILASIAFVYFARENTDSAIFEVGLGGRLDATNVLNPEISVITPISFDHTDILGNTLDSIAREKCGIIREGGKVVSAPQPPEALEVIKEVCKSKGAKLWIIGEDMFCEDLKCDLKGATFKIDGEEYSLPLIGRHQVINALTAIYTAQVYGIPRPLIKKGVSEVSFHGRLEIIDKNPWVVFDGAHNTASAWVLRRSIVELFDFRHLILIFGVLKDKDKEGLIKILGPITNYAFITPLQSPRSADSNELLEIFKRVGVKAKIVKNPITALTEAREKAGPRDLILASGSLYLMGELLSSLE